MIKYEEYFIQLYALPWTKKPATNVVTAGRDKKNNIQILLKKKKKTFAEKVSPRSK